MAMRFDKDYTEYCNNFESSRQTALKNAEQYQYAQSRLPAILEELQNLI